MSAAGSRVLIVDDEPANLILLRRVLSRAGYSDLHATSDPLEALPLFDALEPDLVLLDLRMPRLDGFAILTEIVRRVPPDAYVPVLILTAEASPDARELALATGARDFVTKPFDPVEVVQRVRNLLQTRELHVALAAERSLLAERVEERTAQLSAALADARAAGRARAQFLANVSHELRTPLTALRGSLGLLGRAAGELPPAATRLLEVAGSNTERLLRLIEDLLLLQALECGEVRAKHASVDVSGLTRAVAARYADPARERTLTLLVDAPVDLAPLSTDESLLGDVLSRLVDNAVRFTEQGQVQLRVTRGEDGAPACVAVRDTGRGVPAERMSAIFEAFEQVDNSDTRGFGGLGLGLAICRATLALLGWSMRVESEIGKGSEFILLPPPPPRIDRRPPRRTQTRRRRREDRPR